MCYFPALCFCSSGTVRLQNLKTDAEQCVNRGVLENVVGGYVHDCEGSNMEPYALHFHLSADFFFPCLTGLAGCFIVANIVLDIIFAVDAVWC